MGLPVGLHFLTLADKYAQPPGRIFAVCWKLALGVATVSARTEDLQWHQRRLCSLPLYLRTGL